MRIHVINPNRLTAVTYWLEASARRVARSGTDVHAFSGQAGPESAESHTEGPLGGLAVARATVQGTAQGADAFVVVCFGNAGVHAARDLTEWPVVGMTGAVYCTAARFTVMTLPARTEAHAIRGLHDTGPTHRVRVDTVEVAVDLEEEATAPLSIFLEPCRRALANDHSASILLVCAGLSELIEPLSIELAVPVIDGVPAAVTMSEGLVIARRSTSSRSSYAHIGRAVITGLSR